LLLAPVAIASGFMLAGCVGESTLDPTPAIYVGTAGRQQFVTPASAQGERSMLYVTDRAPVAAGDGPLAYGSERSRIVSFGSVDIAIDRGGAGQQAGGGQLRVGAITRVGEFPSTPYLIESTPRGFRRDPAVVAAHERAVAQLQAEVARRLVAARRKEVVVFVHGYNNTFEDAVRSTGNICEFLGEEFVCIVMSWPAGGTKGLLFGYNVDRESGEFAVADFKKVIRAISETRGVERIHLIAHSRGSDVLASALQQLGIESYVSQSFARSKVANVVLCAPDLDIDVARSKIFDVPSDPDLPFGRTAKPGVTLPLGDLHLTVYSSPNDKALGASGLLFGSLARLGQVVSEPDSRSVVSHYAGLVDFIEFKGQGGLISHDYCLANPKVSADLVALIRYRLSPGAPGRPLKEVSKPFWLIPDADGPSP
jgi:esterase/lipase superfamily enzyme